MGSPSNLRIRFSAVLTIIFAFIVLLPPSWAINIQRVQSPGGIEAWLVKDVSVPVISFSFSFRGGASADPKGKEGRAEMVSGLLDEGAGNLTSQEFQSSLENIAARIGFTASTDRFSGTLRTLSANKDEAFRLLALAIEKPRFDQKPVERIRGQMIAGLKAVLQDPNAIATRTWYKTVFPRHPYGRPNSGTIDSVKSVTVLDLKSFVTNYFVRKSLIVGVAGDITAEDLRQRLDQIFGSLPVDAAAEAIEDVMPAGAGRQLIVKREIPQSIVMFGHVGIARTDADWYPAYIMMRVLGAGGFYSRLNEEVREKRGLAYSVYSYLNPLDHAALIMGGVATANARVEASLKIIKAEWKRMATNGITKNELASAKTYINGSFPLRLDSSRRIAGMLVAVQINKLGIDYLNIRSGLMNMVTVDDVKRVAKRLLKANDLTIVIVGKPQGLTSTP